MMMKKSINKMNVIVEVEGTACHVYGVDECNHKVVDKKAFNKAAKQLNVLNTLRGNKIIDDTDPKFNSITLNKQIIEQHIDTLNNVRTLYNTKVGILKDKEVKVSYDVDNKVLNIDIPIFSIYTNLYTISSSSKTLNEHDALYNLLHIYNPRVIDHTGIKDEYVKTPELISSADNKSANWQYGNVHSILDSREKAIQECLMRRPYSRFTEAQINQADAYLVGQLTKLMKLSTGKNKVEIDKKKENAEKVFNCINEYIANNVDRHVVNMNIKKCKKVRYACGHNYEGEPTGFKAFLYERISIKVDSLVSKTNAGRTIYEVSNVTKLRELITIDELLMSL